MTFTALFIVMLSMFLGAVVLLNFCLGLRRVYTDAWKHSFSFNTVAVVLVVVVNSFFMAGIFALARWGFTR